MAHPQMADRHASSRPASKTKRFNRLAATERKNCRKSATALLSVGDVLIAARAASPRPFSTREGHPRRDGDRSCPRSCEGALPAHSNVSREGTLMLDGEKIAFAAEIGRASCRERGAITM